MQLHANRDNTLQKNECNTNSTASYLQTSDFDWLMLISDINLDCSDRS